MKISKQCTSKEYAEFAHKCNLKRLTIVDNSDSWQGIEQEVSISELKTQKWQEVKSARNKTEQNGFEYMGKVFDSDTASVIRINSALISAQLAIANDTELQIKWTTKDNSTILLNAQQMLDCAVALAEHLKICHIRSQELRVLIEAASTKEELTKIDWLDN